VVEPQAKPPLCFWFNDKYVSLYETTGVNHYNRKDCIPPATATPEITTATPEGLKDSQILAVSVGQYERVPRSDPIRFKDIFADYNGNYEYSSGYITIPSDDYYYFSINAGVEAGQAAEMGFVTTNSRFLTIPGIYRKSTSHDGTDTISREWFGGFEKGERFGARAITQLYSNEYDQVSFSMFNLNLVAPQYYFNGYRSTELAVGSTDVNIGLSLYTFRGTSPSAGLYICPETGVYYFSFSAGVKANEKVRINIEDGANVFQLLQDQTHRMPKIQSAEVQ
jgi:hypothetical protein